MTTITNSRKTLAKFILDIITSTRLPAQNTRGQGNVGGVFCGGALIAGRTGICGNTPGVLMFVARRFPNSLFVQHETI
jgi:hypothetical protein